jgi:hypothetical protein
MSVKRIYTKTDNKSLDAAVRRRVQDQENVTQTARNTDMMANQFLGQHRFVYSPLSGDLTRSKISTEHVKDMRFFTNYFTTEVSRLTDIFNRSLTEAERKLRSLEAVAKTTSSDVKEMEIRQSTGYEIVHNNNFGRIKDANIGAGVADWTRDFKTGFTFLAEHQAKLIPYTGLTLPWQSYSKYPIREVSFVSSQTDFGDTKHPILSTSARNLIVEGQPFRHVILLRQFDEYGNRYLARKAQVVFNFDLPVSFPVNSIKILPCNDSIYTIDHISYTDTALIERDLAFEQVKVQDATHLVFGTVNAIGFTVTLVQSAPVDVVTYDANGLREKELNKVLDGSGFRYRFTESQDAMTGAVYDFSVTSIEIGYIKYNSLGLYRSLPVKATGALGMSLTPEINRVETTAIDTGIYGYPTKVPEDINSVEFYLGLTLKRGASQIYRDLIPIPDSDDELQTEVLPLVGSQARVKLMPDLTANSLRYVINYTGATEIAETVLYVSLLSAHGLEAGDTFFATSGPSSLFDGTYIVHSVINETDFAVDVGAEITPYIINSRDLPRGLIYVPQTDPFVVGKDSGTLEVGVDYVYSIDGGVTWFDTFALPLNWPTIKRNLRAGDFVVKFLSCEQTAFYWIKYTTLYNQILGHNKHVRLGRRNVVFSGRLKGADAEVSTVIVMRKFSTESSATSVVVGYYLGINQ